MTFFVDFKNAVNNYPSTGVDLEIVEVELQGNFINPNDLWKFKVKVINRGFLNMDGVILQVNALGGARVATSRRGPFVDPDDPDVGMSVSVGPLTVNSGRSQESDFVFFKAPDTTQSLRNLAAVTIEAWDGNINSLMINHSTSSSTPSAHYQAEVFPTLE